MDAFEEQPPAGEHNGADAAPNARPSLARLLDEEGFATRDEVEDAFVEGAHTGERLGEVLLRRAIVDEAQLARLLARQWGLAFVPSERVEDAAPAAIISRDDARAFGAAALHLDEKVYVVVAEPTDARIGEIRRRFGNTVEIAVVVPGALEHAVAKSAPTDPPMPPPAHREPEPEPAPRMLTDTATVGGADENLASPLGDVLAELDRGTTKLLLVRAKLEQLVTRIAEHEEVTARYERELAEARRQREEDQATVGRLRAELEQRNETLSFLRTKLREISSSLDFHQGG